MKTYYTLFLITIVSALVFSQLFAFSADIYSLYPMSKLAFEKSGSFVISKTTSIAIPENANSVISSSISRLQSEIKRRIGDTLSLVPYSSISEASKNFIFISDLTNSLEVKNLATKIMPAGELLSNPEGYFIDITNDRIYLIGADPNGAFNSVSSLLQLFNQAGNSISLNSAHVWDFPDYPDRWVFTMFNLRGNNAITDLKNILDTMATYKLNGIQEGDYKFNVLQDQPKYYFDSVTRFKNLCFERNIEIIPAVANIGWSDGILVNHPNLAEGIPTSAEYVIENDTARLIPDARVSIPNGGFENLGSNGKFTGWDFYDEAFATQDKTVFHSGSASAKCTNFDGTNSRFNKLINCQPYRGYLLTAWIKTQNFKGDDLRLFAYGLTDPNIYRALTFTSYSIPQTTDWMKIEVTFNTLYHTKVYLYAGVWGARSGTLWWDDFQIKDIGLTNILRRDGTPLTVTKKSDGVQCIEGQDFEPVVDSIMNSKYGSYGPYHQPPAFKRKTSGKIQNGDSLIIRSYHPFTSVSDVQGNGSVMVCVSEDTLYSILSDQMTRVDNLFKPDKFFMGHDEIRNMNWDSSCQIRNLSPAELLADNMNKCNNILKGLEPNSNVYMWSDMVDSLHNAINNYYLINGDLSGIWNKIPKSIVIANWNGGKMKESLKFFSDLGFSQITSPYYDVQSTDNIRSWRLAQEGIPNIRGTMYTTWNTDYSFLKPFAYYAWGAGPAIVHKPIDSLTAASSIKLQFEAKVFPDQYDNTDKIVSVYAKYSYLLNDIQTTDSVILNTTGLYTYSSSIDKFTDKTFSYKIIAVNQQGLIRETPEFIVNGNDVSSIDEQFVKDKLYQIEITPNPVSTNIVIKYYLPGNEQVNLTLFDIYGHEIRIVAKNNISGKNSEILNISDIADGIYYLRFNTNGFETTKIICKIN